MFIEDKSWAQWNESLNGRISGNEISQALGDTNNTRQ